MTERSRIEGVSISEAIRIAIEFWLECSDPITADERRATPRFRVKKQPKTPTKSAPAPKTPPDEPSEDRPIAVRPRDLIWDAIVEITGVDSSIKANAAHIGKVKKSLLEANPPYTPEEILGLPRVAASAMPWTAGRPLTLGEIPKYIGHVRNPGASVPENGKARSAMEEFLSAGEHTE